jgi:(p)ppGpp synthase/HD superfamily hydrolase
MVRDTLELADDSLFIDKIRHTFAAADGSLLTRAYAFSREKAGELDSTPFQAADLLIDQGADALTVICALLAPLLWQDLADLDDIQKHFDARVVAELKGLNPPSILRSDTRQYCREDIHSLLASMGSVPRKALLFIAFRLLALENAADSREVSTRKMAQETLDFYVPIANRLSLGELRRRLENACFHVLDPEGYEILRQKAAPIQAEDDKCLQILLTGVRILLKDNGIQGRIQGRTKSLYGLRRKMRRTGKTLEQIMDRIGLRVIVKSVPECYAVLGLLHSHFKPIPGTFDDYIGLPKENGYQSLHTCVYPVREISHKPIEFQVRTELMHMEAEYGTAAHWLYKSETAAPEQNHYQVQWMEGLARQHEKADSAEDFVELLHRQVFQDHLVVFGNGGRIVRLHEKATVQDYLNVTNAKVPKGAIVKINGKIADMDRHLRDGDSIEVLACDDSLGSQAVDNVGQNDLAKNLRVAT